MKLELLSYGRDSKTPKGAALGVATAVLYLTPSDVISAWIPKARTCFDETDACKAHCVYKQGRGAFNNVQKARIRKTKEFFQHRESFLGRLDYDLRRFAEYCAKHKLTAAVRLNGTSDLPFESFIEMRKYPTINFYDYTKSYKRAMRFARGEMPSNYDITFSLSESNYPQAYRLSKRGVKVAVVFANAPQTYFGNTPVIDGDASDARFLDPGGAVVGLTPKGSAKNDKSGFVVR